MNNPGIYSTGDFTLTTGETQTGDWVEDLEGVLGLSFQARLAYGSGGTTAKVYLQTSLDQGTTAIDIACMVFTTVSEVDVVNLSGLTPKTSNITPTDSALADDTVVDGILGDMFRVKVVSTGVYGGSTVVSTRICVR